MIHKYAFINAKVKARRSLRLDEDFFQVLQRSRSLQEAVQLFRDTPYQSLCTIYNESGDIRLVEKELLVLEIDLYGKIKSFLPGDVAHFSESFFLKYEIDSLKVALRLWYVQCIREMSISAQLGYFLPVSIAHIIDFKAVINASSEKQLLSLLKHTPYYDVLEEGLLSCRQNQSLFHSEWALDSFFYRQVLAHLALLERKDRTSATLVLQQMIDRQNLLTLLLFRSSKAFPSSMDKCYYLEGGEKLNDELFLRAYSMNVVDFRELLHKLFPRLSFKSLNQTLPLLFQDMEKDLNHLSSRLAAGNPFSLGVILSWYLSGQDELRKIKRLLNDKYYEEGH
ncbi:MAG: hypothetical protein B6241_04410 [Spirochaetaceae bacterium 4572_59]|nr:MAG: hypothetical protein B6241_04410 [Spirochaetaceae bacterium 4572_59]